MLVSEIIALFRTEVADIEMPYLWTEDEVLTYLNDAYTMFTRFLGGVSDASSTVTSVTVAANDTEITLDPSIIRVVRAFRADGTEIGIIENTDTPLVKDASGKLTLLRVGSRTGPVEFLVLGAEKSDAALHPIPLVGDTLKLQVRRLPIKSLGLTASATVATSPDDLRTEHHIHLLKWMKAMAYRKQDSETLDPAKAQENEALFLQYCSQSVYEQERMRRKSRASLRTGRDMKNPMLAASAYTARPYSGDVRPPQRQGRDTGSDQ